MRSGIPAIAALSAAALSAAAIFAAEPAPVPYPDGYRSWRHVKSMVIQEGHPLYESFGGIHHIYANEPALEGYRTGSFPDGAVIVFDLLEASADGNAITEGARKVVGVMHKDDDRYASTGGWGFEGFAGDSRTDRVVGDQAAAACFACHQAQAGADYVFSAYRP
ncbi:MAG TPA: cytochrome P460 family protein [Gammaproteobacteria bacterium]